MGAQAILARAIWAQASGTAPYFLGGPLQSQATRAANKAMALCCAPCTDGDSEIKEISPLTAEGAVEDSDTPSPDLGQLAAELAAEESATHKVLEPEPESEIRKKEPKPPRPEPSVEVVFDTGAGELKTVWFLRRPLGLDFYETVPMKVKRVKDNSHAKELDIQPSWIVKSVNGTPFANVVFSEDFQFFSQCVMRLP
eukprot:NODE_4197_length_700_cov_366.655814.p2 GENE.NODE_4197_length_700_cov_366.655814~~NODE_4197_length_700_cov_366.655814.p2  ORF type:complete len:197 (+),score=50.38 NODE_4197_length_700_cov_366.655814:3-593(+)